MTLSNTAAPKYYMMFREAVLRGEIPICKEIELEMNRIDKLIANPKYFYDPRPVEGFIRYCEKELTLTDGEPLTLLPTFKLWAEQVFSWYYFAEREVYTPGQNGAEGVWITKVVKKRLTTKQFLIVARGGAKSMYASCIQSYFLNIDPYTTHQITTAPTMKQADEVMSPFRTAIVRAPGPLFKFLTEGSLQNTTGSRALRQKLVSTKKGIENFLTGSLLEVRPMSINKLQGLRTKINTVDEWLSGDIREDVIGAIEQGASKEPNYLIVAISSEGTVRNAAGDSIKLELAKILRGEYEADHVSIWHYKLDNTKEVNDPSTWVKAQPNINVTVTYDIYHQEVARMEAAPSNTNDILAKRFGIPREGMTYFFTYEETLPHKKQRFKGMSCALGADLSQGDDFCAFTFLFPLRRGAFGVKTLSYITELTLAKLPSAMRIKYQEFIDERTLNVMPGTVLNMTEVYEDLALHIDRNEYDICAFGYDPWGAKEFVELFEADHGVFLTEKVPQGARTESVPLGEIKKISEAGLLIFDQLLMMFAMGHCIAVEDTNGNRKLSKKRSEEKIDNVSALLDAYIAYKANKDQFEQ